MIEEYCSGQPHIKSCSLYNGIREKSNNYDMGMQNYKDRLYNIYYSYLDGNTYEATTNNFDRWLKEHNNRRIAEGSEPESTDDFRIEEITPIIYK